MDMETRIEKMMRFKFLKQNNNGSTMVETLVSFTVIAIVMAALYAIVSFSSELWMNSIDASRVQQHFSEEISKKNPDAAFVQKTIYKAGFAGESGNESEYAGLVLVVDDGDDSNQFYISLSDISAESYVSVDDSVKDENIVAPKVLMFKHKSQYNESGE